MSTLMTKGESCTYFYTITYLRNIFYVNTLKHLSFSWLINTIHLIATKHIRAMIWVIP